MRPRKQTAEPDVREMRTETFASRNVKLITFLVCMALFFAFFGPVSFFRVRDCMDSRRTEKMPELTCDDVIGLTEDRSRLSMQVLRRFRGEYNPGDKGNTFTAYFDHYILLAFEDPATGLLTYCAVMDRNSEEKLDLTDKNADAAAFFAANQ